MKKKGVEWKKICNTIIIYINSKHTQNMFYKKTNILKHHFLVLTLTQTPLLFLSIPLHLLFHICSPIPFHFTLKLHVITPVILVLISTSVLWILLVFLLDPNIILLQGYLNLLWVRVSETTKRAWPNGFYFLLQLCFLRLCPFPEGRGNDWVPGKF